MNKLIREDDPLGANLLLKLRLNNLYYLLILTMPGRSRIVIKSARTQQQWF